MKYCFLPHYDIIMQYRTARICRVVGNTVLQEDVDLSVIP